MEFIFSGANDNPAPGATLDDVERVRILYDELLTLLPEIASHKRAAVETALTVLHIAVDRQGSKVRRFNAWADVTDMIADSLPDGMDEQESYYQPLLELLIELDQALEHIAFQEGWEPSLSFNQPEVLEAQDLQKTLATDPIAFRDASAMLEALQEHFAPCLQPEQPEKLPLERVKKAFHALCKRKKDGQLPLPASYKLQQIEPLMQSLLQ